MLDTSISDTAVYQQGQSASEKLRAAREYLGDRLSTHPASRFKPAKRSLLDEWIAARRRPVEARLTTLASNRTSGVERVELRLAKRAV
jgi:hypothetical protein